MLNRITCNFFERSSNGAASKSSHPQVQHERRTIQTNYISTISSLVDKDSFQNESNTIDIESPVFSRPSHQSDAQIDNYGLYALKHNRNACRERRPRAKVPPPVPPPPDHRKIIVKSHNLDIVHEKFQSVETTHKPISEQPRKKKPTEDLIRRAAKGKAPLPIRKPITRSITTEADRNIHSAMLLDTQLLEPPDESLNALTENNSALYRIARMHFQHSSLEDGTSTNVRIAKPEVMVERTEIVKQNLKKTSREQRRNQLVKQHSTTESINIFREATGQADAFDDFNDELNFEPIVVVQRPTNSSVSNFEPTAMNFANRFAAAFAEAFSEEEGITDLSPTHSSPPPELPKSVPPTFTPSHPRRLSNPLVCAPTSARQDHEHLSLPPVNVVSLSSELGTPNLITNPTRFSAVDDNNTTANRHYHHREAVNPTQLRSFSQPNQTMPNINAFGSQNNNNNPNANSVSKTTISRLSPISAAAASRKHQHQHHHHHHHHQMIISESRSGSADAQTTTAGATSSFWGAGFEEIGLGGRGGGEVLYGTKTPQCVGTKTISNATTRRTVYVMNI